MNIIIFINTYFVTNIAIYTTLITFWAVYRFQFLKKVYVKYSFQIDKEN